MLERLFCIQGILMKFYPARKLSRCMQILLQTTPDNLTSFILCFSPLLGNIADTFTEIYKHTYIHIYKYMFGSNFHGLAPERGLRRAFGPTNLLTSLRSGLRPSLREESDWMFFVWNKTGLIFKTSSSQHVVSDTENPVQER